MILSTLSSKFRTLSLNRGGAFFGKHAFSFLNLTQFLSALNDNLFKFLTIYLLIDLKGVVNSNDILFWIGLFYVLPFLFFSSVAGILADRFSKQKLIVLLKVFELIIVIGCFFAYAAKSPSGCYFCVFLLSLQSALMGPSKYSIIPEIVCRDEIPRANGLITSFTYLAIIIGTFLASFLTQVTHKNFTVCLISCLLAAIVGLIASLYIPHTKPRMNKQKISPWVLKQVYTTLVYCKKTPRLILAVCGSSFFLFIGAYLQLNIIPFAIDKLDLTEVGGGYLFLMIAIGIAFGATLAGRACRKEVDLGLPCFALLAISLGLLILPSLAGKLVAALFCLMGLGLFGGLYVVPLESYIQAFSPSEIRGQVVATANFLSFVSVLLAPLALFLFGKVFQVSAATGFTLISLLTLGVFCLLVKYLSAPFLHFISRKFVQPLFDLHYIDYPFGVQYQEDKMALVFENKSWRNLWLMLGESPRLHVFVIKSKRDFFDPLINYLSCFDVVYANEETVLDPIFVQRKLDARLLTIKPIYMFTSKEAYSSLATSGYFNTLMESEGYQVKKLRVIHTSHFKPSLVSPLKRVQMTLHFVDHKVLSHSLSGSSKQEALQLN